MAGGMAPEPARLSGVRWMVAAATCTPILAVGPAGKRTRMYRNCQFRGRNDIWLSAYGAARRKVP